MPDRFVLRWQGEELHLLSERAIYWPRRRSLMLADLHLGKADVFRRAGIAVPRGGTSYDLDRIDGLLARTGASELFVLGDLLHGPVPDAAWLARWREWRESNAALRIAVITGNHDRALSSVELGIEALAAEFDLAPFRLTHVPPHGRVDSATICGHVHPVIRLEGRRWPCYWLHGRTLALPAFSAFTGGFAVPRADSWLGVCVPQGVISLGLGRGPDD